MKKAQKVIFLRSVQAACVAGIGLVGLFGFLMFAGVENYHSVWDAVTENLADTWRAALSFDFDTLVRQWISGALGLAIFAALGVGVVQMLSHDKRN